MKKIMNLALMLLLTILSVNAKAQELEDIVNKHIKAIGGLENWKKVKSMTMNMSMKAQGAEVKLTMNRLQKKGMRVDIDLMGMNGYQIVTDKAGWSFMPFQGQDKPEPMTAEDVKKSQDDLDIMDAFITYKDYGKKIEMQGKDDVEGTDCFKISMTDKDGSVSTYYLDESNYQIIKTVTKKSINGKEIEATITYSNYKELDGGIMMPMAQGGSMGEMEMTSVVVNSGVDESIFQPKALSEIKK